MNHSVTLPTLDVEVEWDEDMDLIAVYSESNPFAMWYADPARLKSDAIALTEFLSKVKRMKALSEFMAEVDQ